MPDCTAGFRLRGFEPRTVISVPPFVGSSALARELGESGDGVIISQVVPAPWDRSIPLVKRYHQALLAISPAAEPDFVSLEGYIVGRMTIMALQETGAKLTRKAFLESIWSTGTFDLDSVTLKFGKDDNQGGEKVYLTRIKSDGSFETLGPAGS